ncbi:uncharacterized protein KGF55_003978 [Candida pseudojiufengensis]|uniref:uncharacterized protein n=1 Tax=Candida pseudojiufengensis TaxID=497109 RepID=UPI00222558BC|nr:uncharacterized protein KGF55_003978 [Candida pseudojiufengensis]KAI5961661.1 hypothetical protein KGF55_003978 [Candida pseudojiufengensis]
MRKLIDSNKDYKINGLNFQPNSNNKVPSSNALSKKLAKQFTYNTKHIIPRILWQTYKVDLNDQSMHEKYKIYHNTFTNESPNHQFHVLSDQQCDELIARLYKDFPDILKAYNVLPRIILKADFFRYLILFAEGGIYSDIDTVSLKPLKDWPSYQEKYLNKTINIGLTVGVEADPNREDWADWYARPLQFCQWTFQSQKGHPMLRELITNITITTLNRESTGQLKAVFDTKDPKNDILNWTGPGIFTDYIFNYLNSMFKRKNDVNFFDLQFFTGMKQPIVINDVMILSLSAFASGGKHNSDSLTDHEFAGSWKNAIDVENTN